MSTQYGIQETQFSARIDAMRQISVEFVAPTHQTPVTVILSTEKAFELATVLQALAFAQSVAQPTPEQIEMSRRAEEGWTEDGKIVVGKTYANRT